MKGKIAYLTRVFLVACIAFGLSVGPGLAQYGEEEQFGQEEQITEPVPAETPETTEAPEMTEAPEVKAPVGTKVSVDFQDVALGSVLKVLSEQTGLNFVAGANVQDKRITLYLTNVEVKDALDIILQSTGLSYEKVGPEESNIYLIKESGKPPIETKTKVFKLSFTQAAKVTEKIDDKEVVTPGLEDVVKQLVSDKGKVITDQRSNSLIIDDIPSQLALIEDIVNQLDAKTPQVMIEAEILETDSDLLKDLGFRWGTGDSGTMFQIFGASTNTGWPWGNLIKDAKVGGPLAPIPAEFPQPQLPGMFGPAMLGAINFNYLSVALNAIESNGATKILARPKILTINNKMAEIKIISKTAIGQVSTITGGGTGVTSDITAAERVETGIVLKVTPIINKDNYVTLLVEPSVTNTSRSIYFPTLFVDPNTRSARTTVMVKDGDTIVIGGLMASEKQEVIRKVPILGDVPILGLAFREKTNNNRNRELVVFLTPHIIKDVTPAVEAPVDVPVKWEPAPVVPEVKPVMRPEEIDKPVVKKADKKRDVEMEKALKDLGAEPVSEEEITAEEPEK